VMPRLSLSASSLADQRESEQAGFDGCWDSLMTAVTSCTRDLGDLGTGQRYSERDCRFRYESRNGSLKHLYFVTSYPQPRRV
jgi:hypothetical protein